MKDYNQIKTQPTLELLAEIESRLATGLFTSEELRTLSRILAANYSTIFLTLTLALQQERLRQQELLSQLSPQEKEQVDEFLKEHGFKKKDYEPK